MLANPYLEQKVKDEKEKREREAFRYPIIITCVVPYIEDLKENNSFRIVKRFCDENHIAISAREYDFHKYNEDRDEISKMPAFHLYDKKSKSYMDTFFWDENPVQKIMDEIVRLRKEDERKQARKEAWERKVAGLIAFFEGLSFKKKPKIQVPERPKSLPSKVPLEFIDALPKNRKNSL